MTESYATTSGWEPSQINIGGMVKFMEEQRAIAESLDIELYKAILKAGFTIMCDSFLDHGKTMLIVPESKRALVSRAAFELEAEQKDAAK